jgi:hypothetical protein
MNIEISTLHGYIEYINEEKDKEEKIGNGSDFIFRGQKQNWDLKPKLVRLNLRGELKKIEDLILAEFERTSMPLSEFQPKDKWELIALAQHHGLPTRLLDWTYSAFVALWFAVKDTAPKVEKDQEYGVVWILKTKPSDFKNKNDLPFTNNDTKIFRPNVISRRISAQSGAFTVHEFIKNNPTPEDAVVMLDTHSDFKDRLIKIKIPHKNFPDLRNKLNIAGINSSTVFPDIDGLCKHLEWCFTHDSDENNANKKLSVG